MPYSLCLGGLSKDFFPSNAAITRLRGYVYDFSVDYWPIAADKILDIHKYLMEKNNMLLMFGFIKKVFFTAMKFFSSNVLNVNSLECHSMNNQECKIRSEIINVNNNEPMFYLHSIKMCKGSCNTINDPFAKLCVPGGVKNINVKVFNLMPRTNETRHIE